MVSVESCSTFNAILQFNQFETMLLLSISNSGNYSTRTQRKIDDWKFSNKWLFCNIFPTTFTINDFIFFLWDIIMHGQPSSSEHYGAAATYLYSLRSITVIKCNVHTSTCVVMKVLLCMCVGFNKNYINQTLLSLRINIVFLFVS